MLNLPVDYYICCSISVVGVVQIASNTANLDKFKFIQNGTLNGLLAFSLLIASFIIFFFTADRNVNDINGGLNGNQQMILFGCSFMTGFIANASISSFINHSNMNQREIGDVGIEKLRRSTYWQILKEPVINWLKFLKTTITK